MYVTKNPGMNVELDCERTRAYTRNFLYFKVTEKIKFMKELTI